VPYWEVQCSKEGNHTGKSSEVLLAQILSYLERYFTKSKRKVDEIMLSNKWELPQKEISEEENIDQITAMFGNINVK